MLPPRPRSVLVGRNAMLAWLHYAPAKYDEATVLLLATEVLAHALDDCDGPIVLRITAEDDGLMRVEVQDSPSRRILEATDIDAAGDAGRRLRMIRGLADRWGTELRLTDDEAAVRVTWFECRPLATGSS